MEETKSPSKLDLLDEIFAPNSEKQVVPDLMNLGTPQQTDSSLSPIAFDVT